MFVDGVTSNNANAVYKSLRVRLPKDEVRKFNQVRRIIGHLAVPPDPPQNLILHAYMQQDSRLYNRRKKDVKRFLSDKDMQPALQWCLNIPEGDGFLSSPYWTTSVNIGGLHFGLQTLQGSICFKMWSSGDVKYIGCHQTPRWRGKGNQFPYHFDQVAALVIWAWMAHRRGDRSVCSQCIAVLIAFDWTHLIHPTKELKEWFPKGGEESVIKWISKVVLDQQSRESNESGEPAPLHLCT